MQSHLALRSGEDSNCWYKLLESGGQALKFMFTPEELQLLDSYPEGEDEPAEEEAPGMAPDLETLNVPEAKAENDEVGQEKQIVMKDGILREGFGDVAW